LVRAVKDSPCFAVPFVGGKGEYLSDYLDVKIVSSSAMAAFPALSASIKASVILPCCHIKGKSQCGQLEIGMSCRI
jgi:hypothetical protein